MDREQAKELIRDTFESPFDKGRFVNFIKNLLNTIDYAPFDYYGQYIPDPYKSYINRYERIGKYSDGENRIDILIIYLKRQTSIERARSMQRNFIAGYLKGNYGSSNDKDAALVAFVSPDEEDWRFSLVEMDYRFEEGKSGRVKVREEFTPARRWSFLVGKNEKSHTAQSRLVSILEDDEHNPTLKQLEEAFNIEPVTKEFFDKYRGLLIRTVDALDKIVKRVQTVKKEFESKNINTVDFAKKLLGQIVFLYFLQKKGWFGVERGKPWGEGPKDFMRRLFNKEYGDYENFFNGILEPLFYEALRTDRSSADHYYSRFNCKIPFLNGGLFDPINNYDWVNTEITIPDELFSNTRRTKEGDIGDGILDVFDRFNFTVNEEEPLEKEVALDPELLGKIYEKLNAIRPDNFDEYLRVLKSGKKGEETKFNKEYGVYYTPREIVHYMCQESLINYLETELKKKCPREDIEKFVKFADSIHETEEIVIEKEKKIKSGKQETTKYESQLPDSIKSNAKEIDRLLADIKVCDPAVGSGAFPIGMMHEIVKLRRLLLLFTGTQKTNYGLKRHCIENSLYGVDIDPGAVEICKLRFWLSMIVDEEDIYQIKPLPNLDYKIVCGDSLLGFPSNLNSPIEKEIQSLMDKYFSEINPIEKERLKRQIDERIKYRLEQSEKIFGYKINFDFPLFFPKVFREKNGFDVVIENPPYVRQERIKQYKPLLKKTRYEIYNSTSDLYSYFYEKSFKITKPEGIICIISSNKWMRAKYGEKLRNLLKNKTIIKQIIDFNGYSVFEATVDTNIILFQKRNPADNSVFFTITIDPTDFKTQSIGEYIKERHIQMEQKSLQETCFVLAENKILKLKEKIEKIGVPLNEWNIRINRGVLTGYNKAFIIDNETKEKLCRDDPKSIEILKPILRGRDIGRYYYRWAGLWVIATFPSKKIDINRYPAVKNYLKSFGKRLEQSGKPGCRKKTPHKWFETQDNIAFWKDFEKEKIVWAGVGKKLEATIVSKDFYINNPANFMVAENLRYLIAIFNAKLTQWYYDKIKTQLGQEGGRFYIYDIFNLPIPPFTLQNKSITQRIEQLVDKILSLTQSSDYLKNKEKQAKVKEYQRQIDQLVYQLYGLTEEEIRIIEGKDRI
ncbi:MAG: class I SAM-dependent DNA methyltransferase [Thermodesulfobacteriota bacterium]|nr:MAG: class I SAM-dependent DNA methyltransferase [Thermodesulfobacteriota bacterium]